MFDPILIRKFIKDSINRAILVQSLRTSPGILSENTKAFNSLLKKIEISPMYYPFYAGTANPAYDIENEPGDLDQLFTYYKKTDLSYSTYPTLQDEIADFQNKSPNLRSNIEDYFNGKYWSQYLSELEKRFTQLQTQIQIEEKMKSQDGKIRIRILYNNEDPVSAEIYRLFTRNLIELFAHLNSRGKCKAPLTIVPVRPQGKNLNAISPREYELVIYGWNYGFDFLAELRPFLTYSPASRLSMEYHRFFSTISQVSVLDHLFDMAKVITDNELITTLVGIPNYVIYDSGRVRLSSLDKLGAYMIMYPYYWRTNAENIR
jgi:hypothetical protein